MSDTCPSCGASYSKFEKIDGGWFCPSCGERFFDDDGEKDTEDKFILFQEFKAKYMADKKQRKGQAIFNALREADYHLYEELTGTKFDCFYNDSKIDACLAFIYAKWAKEY